MEFTLLGWPADAPTLRLDYRRFSYAGKFVTEGIGVAVVRGDPDSESDDAGGVANDSAGDADNEALPPLPDGLTEAAFADDVLAAVSFSPDRTDRTVLKIRYLTVRDDFRGSGHQLGPKLVVFLTQQAADDYNRLQIGVNNVFSYHALYKAGFAYTGRETGLAELVLERPAVAVADRSRARYQRGLDVFRQREGLSNAETDFLASHVDSGPPELVSAVRSG